VSWATFWAKAKENHARSRRAIWRGRAFMVGAIFAAAGGYGLYSDVRHQIHGKPATATLMEHIKQCTVEYQCIGEEKRKEQWPCEKAEGFQRLVGSKKVKISYNNIARVQFPLEDGRTHEAKVDDIKLGSYRLAIGATLPVTYAPNNPADVRAKMSWETLKVPLIMLAIGFPCLAIGLGVPLAALFGGGAFRGRGEETASVTSEHVAPAATQVSGGIDSNKVPRNPVAQTAVNTYSRTTGSAPRASFGMRNR
jgi:hypothetical protein